MSALPQAIAPKLHTNLLNVYIQLANKMGLKKSFDGLVFGYEFHQETFTSPLKKM
jgi:hypothetical protein